MDAPFEIDRETGTLRFPHLGLTLTPRQSLDDFRATEVGAHATNRGSNDGWQRYHLLQPFGEGMSLSVSLYYFNAFLMMVHFGYLPESERNWSAWSKERELARAESYQREIARQLGRRGHFLWGRTDGYYDDKAASAGIFVKYG